MELNKFQEWEVREWRFRFQELEEAGIALKKENIEAIIEHMKFEKRSKRNSKRCTLYPTGKSCHPEVEDLNCLLCACPSYNNFTLRGACREKSPKGFYYQSIADSNVQVWDCSNCTRYHSTQQVRAYLAKNFENLLQLSCAIKLIDKAEQTDRPA
jgi:Zn-finger protein